MSYALHYESHNVWNVENRIVTSLFGIPDCNEDIRLISKQTDVPKFF